MKNNADFHPIFVLLQKMMNEYCRRDFKKMNIQIQRPNIPEGEKYIFVRKHDPYDQTESEFRFYLETGNIKVFIDGEEFTNDKEIKEWLDDLAELLGFIERNRRAKGIRKDFGEESYKW